MPVREDDADFAGLFGRREAGPERRELRLPEGLRHWVQWTSEAGVEVTPESVAMLPVMLYAWGGRGG